MSTRFVAPNARAAPAQCSSGPTMRCRAAGLRAHDVAAEVSRVHA